MTSAPFGDTAHQYKAQGWSPICIPPRKKAPPPTGWTGYDGIRASGADIQSWIEDGHAGDNIALRLPDTILGIDVDAYGDKPGQMTFLNALVRLGNLPVTVRSSSRPDDLVSGIRFYRVPGGRCWADTVGGEGSGIEVIHHGHRYAVVAPSIHPEGRPYQWWAPDGSIMHMPHINDFPDLPPAWVIDLDRGDVTARSRKTDVSSSGVVAFLDACPQGPPCRYMQRLSAELTTKIKGAASRHDMIRNAVAKMVRAGDQGHTGIRETLKTAQTLLMAERALTDSGEFVRLVTGAVGFCIEDPCGAFDKGCCPPEPTLPAPVDATPQEVANVAVEAELALNRDVSTELYKLRVRQAAKDALQAEQDALEAGTSTLAAELLDADQLDQLPTPQPLINDVINRHSYCILRGRDGTYKTFTAIDWALCLATGKPWQGNATEQVRVLYIAAEGAYGIHARKKAWESSWGYLIDPKKFTILPRSINLFSAVELPALLTIIEEGRYGLVIIDTLRRVSGKADGNGSDMGVVIDNMDTIKRATDEGSVLVLTHTDKNDTDSRGFSGIEDDADIVWHNKFEDGLVHIRCTKMKDAPDGQEFTLTPTVSLDSVVLSKEPDGPYGDQFSASQGLIIGVMREMFSQTGATATELKEVTGLANSTFYRCRNALLKGGEIVSQGPDSRPRLYLTHSQTVPPADKPLSRDFPTIPTSLPNSGPIPSHPTTLKGWEGETETGKPAPDPAICVACGGQIEEKRIWAGMADCLSCQDAPTP